VLKGRSIGAAGATGFRLLADEKPYDTGCLLAAEVKGDQLLPVEEEEAKLRSARAVEMTRVGLAIGDPGANHAAAIRCLPQILTHSQP